MPTNVRYEIRSMLEEQGCSIREDAGIWYITTPEGEEWDMTVPMNTEEKTKMWREEVAAGRQGAERPARPRKKDGKIPCSICGEPTDKLGTSLCNGCWEVESRLDAFLRSKNGLGVIKQRLQSLRLIRESCDAQELVHSVDELEEYTRKLNLARDTIATGELNKIMGWVQQDKLDFIKRYIREARGIDEMTLTQLHDRFSVYFPEV